jgi:4'-phosphopantetheinyl transferase EntD
MAPARPNKPPDADKPSLVIPTTPHADWELAFITALPHGMLAGVHLPPHGEPAPGPVLARLAGPEREAAQRLRAYRQVSFVGGRLAMAWAIAEFGSRRAAILSTASGAPQMPPGLSGSLSHKRDLAVALVLRGEVGLGVDVEDTDRERPGVAARVLTPAEFEANQALPEARRWVDAILRFSVKEAVYKAIHPVLQRYVGFGEVEVWPAPDGCDEVRPLSPDVAAFRFEARHSWLGSRVLSTVRARR